MVQDLSSWLPVADRVWRLVAQPAGVNIGLVVGDTGTLLIDTGSSPEQGAAIRQRAAEIAPITHVAITHWHYDHFFGLPAFTDLPSVGHSSLAEKLLTPELFQQAAELRIDPRELVAPGELIELATTIDLGGVRAEIVHFGPAHTPGDVVVILPDRDVVFAGDLLESSDPPQFELDSTVREWPTVLDGILGVLGEKTAIVPGHGEPVDRMFAFRQRAEIAAVYSQAEWLVQQGVPLADAFDKGEWPFDEGTIRGALPLIYDELAAAGQVPKQRLPLRPLI